MTVVSKVTVAATLDSREEDYRVVSYIHIHTGVLLPMGGW